MNTHSERQERLKAGLEAYRIYQIPSLSEMVPGPVLRREENGERNGYEFRPALKTAKDYLENEVRAAKDIDEGALYKLRIENDPDAKLGLTLWYLLLGSEDPNQSVFSILKKQGVMELEGDLGIVYSALFEPSPENAKVLATELWKALDKGSHRGEETSIRYQTWTNEFISAAHEMLSRPVLLRSTNELRWER